MLVKAKVFPNSKKQEIIKKANDSFEIKVKSKPENGKANKEVIIALSLYFKISQDKIKLVKGKKQRNKVFKLIYF